jgi:hypothetical protein
LAQKVGVSKILENTAQLLMCAFVWWRGKKIATANTRY